MSKKYRCISNQSGGLHYLPGEVYILNDDGSMMGELGHAFKGIEYSSAVEWLEHMNWYSFEEVKEMEFIKNGKINLDALKTGDWIECERTTGDAISFQVMKDTPVGVVFREYPNNQSSVCYRADRKCGYEVNISEYRMIKVFRSEIIPNFCTMHIRPFPCVFEWHAEVKRKKMTVEEVEELLGYKVAIVDQEGK